LQSVEAILQAYAKALLIDRASLKTAQMQNDTVRCGEILQEAYQTDVRPLLAEARLRSGGALDPIQAYRDLGVRQKLVEARGHGSVATGL
ncbi:MAG TPA: sugar isomerase, partial [Saprospiraceae bacterium]|nr:sugar isomerase [Saprospiraceae bacterium]